MVAVGSILRDQLEVRWPAKDSCGSMVRWEVRERSYRCRRYGKASPARLEARRLYLRAGRWEETLDDVEAIALARD